MFVCCCYCWKGRDRRIPGAYWPDRPDGWVSSREERGLVSKKKKKKSSKDSNSCCLLSSTCIHTHMNMDQHTCDHSHKHTHICFI